MATFAILTVIFCIITQTLSQENIDTNVANSVKECYNTSEIIEANKKLPMTMNFLIDLIRKIENGPAPMDLKMLSISLLHRFRQDGIRQAFMKRSIKTIPYSPTGHEFHKFKIILGSLVPGNQNKFPNETLSVLERCTIHHMLSESIETIERGDEDKVCNKKEKYRLRVRRGISKLPQDVEIIPQNVENKKPKKSKIQMTPNVDVDIITRGNSPNNPTSSCPLEYGVVYSKWGAVSAGSVIAGIAAGSEPQNADITQVDNVMGSTLAGDLAEAGYLTYGSGNENVQVGADGGWDSAQVPHGYYLSKTSDYYMTDAEIRGGLDGLILGTRMKDYRNSVRSLKLSQLLDMYYSERGVFSEKLKACRRQELFTEYAPTDKLQKEAYAFAKLLRTDVVVSITIDDETIKQATDKAVQALSTYIPSFRDVNCLNENTNYQVVKTDLVILLDCSWNFDTIYPILSYLIDNIDVNPYNSNVTIINANNGELIMNSSYSIAEFHETFNSTLYDKQSKGFDLKVSMKMAEDLTRIKMDNEKSNNDPTGKSMIVLFLARSTNIDATVKQLINTRITDVIKPQMPDLKLLALTASAKEDFYDIVKDSSKDIYTINDNANSDNIVNSVAPLVSRIKQVPNRIISYKCGANWTVEGTEKQLTQFLEPNGITYYRLHPNYFFESDGTTRTVTIKGAGPGTLNVCHSRGIDLSLTNSNDNRFNTSGSDTDVSAVECKQIVNSVDYTIEMVDPCYSSASINECQPLYVSVKAAAQTNGNREMCRDKGCRYPDNLKYTITVDNLGCYSGAEILFTNAVLFISMLCIALAANIHN